jgi:hypothetical protein
MARILCHASGSSLGGFALAGWAALLLATPAQADLGTLRISEEQAGERVTVFTSPAPLRAGPVEVKVLVQQGNRTVTDAAVRVTARRGDRQIRASAEPALPFQAAILELDQAGSWHFEVEVAGATRAGFTAEAAEPAPSWQALAPWIVWPMVPVLLFLAHQWLVRTRTSQEKQ